MTALARLALIREFVPRPGQLLYARLQSDAHGDTCCCTRCWSPSGRGAADRGMLQSHAHVSLVPTAPDAQTDMLAHLQLQHLTFTPFQAPHSELGNGLIEQSHEQLEQGTRTPRVSSVTFLFQLTPSGCMSVKPQRSVCRQASCWTHERTYTVGCPGAADLHSDVFCVPSAGPLDKFACGRRRVCGRGTGEASAYSSCPCSTHHQSGAFRKPPAIVRHAGLQQYDHQRVP